MVRCHQPGCDGTIQDGYCDTSLRQILLDARQAGAIRPRTLT